MNEFGRAAADVVAGHAAAATIPAIANPSPIAINALFVRVLDRVDSIVSDVPTTAISEASVSTSSGPTYLAPLGTCA